MKYETKYRQRRNAATDGEEGKTPAVKGMSPGMGADGASCGGVGLAAGCTR